MRLKLIVITIALFALYGCAIALFSGRIILGGYLSLEDADSEKDMMRIQSTLKREQEYLSDFCADWAHWDDAYNFVLTKDKKFIEDNFYDKCLTDQKLELAYVLDKGGKVVWGTGFNVATGKRYANALFASGSLRADDALIRFPKAEKAENVPPISGYLKVDEGILLVVSYPILRSTGEGPVPGYLVFGRLLDESYIKGLVQLDLNILPLTDRGSKQSLLDGLRKAGQYLYSDSCETRMIYSAYDDVYGNPLFALRLTYPRVIYRQGLNVLHLSFAFLFAIGLSVLILMSIALQHMILSPLNQILVDIAHVTANGDYSRRLGIKRNDEIGTLAGNLDSLMSTIQERTSALDQLNKKLLVLAETDPLTNLPNRRKLDEQMDKELRRISRNAGGVKNQGAMGFIICDIDYFKKYNDSYGHQAGDECLTRVAEAIRSCIKRPADLAARLGGEEFAVILPDTNLEGTRIVAEKMRSAVLALGIENSLSPVLPSLTISLGVACLSPGTANDARAIFLKADQALYLAKENGRNRVEG